MGRGLLGTGIGVLGQGESAGVFGRSKAGPLVGLAITALVGTGVLTQSPSASAAVGDLAVIGDRVSSSGTISTSTGYDVYSAGPAGGMPTTRIDTAAGTVTVSVGDAERPATLTMAWPARRGTWPLDLSGPDPEQQARVTRGARECTYTAGTIRINEADTAPDGGVAALSVDVDGSCELNGGGPYQAAAVRIGDADPARALPLPRAQPTSVSTGALAGTQVRRDITLTNAGAAPWTISRVGTGSSNSWSPSFQVAPETNGCDGVTLATGAQCTVSVVATAPNHQLTEHLVVTGTTGPALVVPLRLEGYLPVPAPTGAAATPGRLASTVTWQPPSTAPKAGYRVYDVTGPERNLVATAPGTATSVAVPGSGSRRLALVAANGQYAESTEVPLEVPAVTSEVVANNRYGPSVAFATHAITAGGRPSRLADVDLDPSRTRWVTVRSNTVSVCEVATEQCTTVPGTTGTSPEAVVREAIWLPDGTLAFLRGAQPETTSLLTVAADGTGLREVAAVPGRAQLAAAPTASEVVVRNTAGTGSIERIRLADGHVTTIPDTGWVDDFTVSDQGLLVLERRVDTASIDGPRSTTVMRLDGTAVRKLALPTGDNRDVTFDPTGTRVAYARHTGEYDATVWVADADGSAPRQLADAVNSWSDLQWSVNNQATPTTSVTGPAISGATTTLTATATDADDPVGALTRQCRLDGVSTWSPCGSFATAAYRLTGLQQGQHTLEVRATDPNGHQSASVAWDWTVDTTAPTTTVSGLSAAQVRSPYRLAWSTTDSGASKASSYDVRMRTAPISGGFGPYTYPTRWQRLTAASLSVNVAPGAQQCLSVRAHDAVGNVGAWSTERCTSMPLDDRALTRSTGWKRLTSSSYVYGTYSRAAVAGARLTRTGVSARRIGVVATTCSTCGTLTVSHAGTALGRVNLVTATTRTRQVLWLPLQPRARTGTLQLRTSSAKQVLVDGIVVAH